MQNDSAPVSWCSAGDVEVEAAGAAGQRVSSGSCWRRSLPGTTVRGLTARCSEINGHGRRLCEKDAPQSCRTSWSADDDRRGVLRAMGSCMSGEMVGFAAPLLPVSELRMPRSGSVRCPRVGPPLEAEGCAFSETGVMCCQRYRVSGRYGSQAHLHFPPRGQKDLQKKKAKRVNWSVEKAKSESE